MRHSIHFFLFLILVSSAFGATIEGDLFDISLERMNAVVSITTQPEQRMVAENGSYAFSVAPGTYILSAQATYGGEQWIAEEYLNITDNGFYVVDLILEPTFQEVDSLAFEDEDIPEVTVDEQTGWTYIGLFILGILIIVSLAMFYTRMLGKKAPIEELREEDRFKQSVLNILAEHDGRISQKELRKQLPFSEAKASLVLTELENEGEIEKIKKGRGNLIIKK